MSDHMRERVLQKIKGAVADKTIEEIRNDSTLLKKVIQVIETKGIDALAEAVDNPIFNFAKDDMETALKS